MTTVPSWPATMAPSSQPQKAPSASSPMSASVPAQGGLVPIGRTPIGSNVALGLSMSFEMIEDLAKKTGWFNNCRRAVTRNGTLLGHHYEYEGWTVIFNSDAEADNFRDMFRVIPFGGLFSVSKGEYLNHVDIYNTTAPDYSVEWNAYKANKETDEVMTRLEASEEWKAQYGEKAILDRLQRQSDSWVTKPPSQNRVSDMMSWGYDPFSKKGDNYDTR